jgi:amino acid adenylation domain-containing protein
MDSMSIQATFAAQVRRTPEAIAVSSGDIRLTYRELAERSGRLAYRLREMGVGPDVPVAVLMERSVDLVVAVLAVLRTGGHYLPLHEAFPLDRMRWIMADAGGPVLLADRAARERGLPTEGPVVMAGAVAGGPGPVAGETPGVGSDALACVIYTSGSTGRPKGVGVTHRGVLGLVADPCWDGGAHERVLMVAPHAFSVSTYELWVPLLRGGQVIVAPPGPIEIARLRQLMVDADATAVHLTAGLFRVIAEEAPETFLGLRQVLTGGDVISPSAVRRVLETCPGTSVRTLYGATETTLFTLTGLIRAPYAGDSAVPVGRPMAGVRAYVLDAKLAPVPDGAEGELYIGGDRLARGYVNRPDLTAQSFIDDPFTDGARMYRTGDLVRRRPDGLIDFLGRATDLVKIRGFRVELGEVEAVLARHPGVRQGAVVARAAVTGEQQLVAYVVPEPDMADRTDGRELADHVASALPDYMVPSAFVTLDALPLTPNGKLDRKALPKPSAGSTTAYRAPQNPREVTLCGLYADVLGTTRVGLDDGFFDLGGDSLLASRLVSRIRGEFGVEVSIADVFNHPAVAELEAHIAVAGEAGGVNALTISALSKKPGRSDS